jgi:uncharacterized membrane protein YkvI
VIIIVLLYRKPQVFITYTGGICGVFIMFLFPLTILYSARKRNFEEKYGHNFNRSPFQHGGWMVLVLAYAILTLVAVITGLSLNGGGSGH